MLDNVGFRGTKSAVVVFTAWTCIGITIFLVSSPKVITLGKSKASEVQNQSKVQPQLCRKADLANINQGALKLALKLGLHVLLFSVLFLVPW